MAQAVSAQVSSHRNAQPGGNEPVTSVSSDAEGKPTSMQQRSAQAQLCNDFAHQGACSPSHPNDRACVHPSQNKFISCLSSHGVCPNGYIPCFLRFVPDSPGSSGSDFNHR